MIAIFLCRYQRCPGRQLGKAVIKHWVPLLIDLSRIAGVVNQSENQVFDFPNIWLH